MNIQERLSHLLTKNTSPIKQVQGATTKEKSQNFFSSVYGYGPVKNIIYRVLTAEKATDPDDEEPLNMILYGDKASGKSLFLDVIAKNCRDVFYFDAANTSGAGFLAELYSVKDTAKIVLVDEVGLLKRNDMDALRGLLSDGHVVKKLKKKSDSYDFWMKDVKVFMTSNDNDFSVPIKSRLTEINLPTYTDEEFVQCVRFCLSHKIPVEVCDTFSSLMLDRGLKDVRKIVKASKLIKKSDTMEEIADVIETLIDYAPKGEIDYN